MSHLRPTITYDNLTGEPSILFDFVDAGNEENTLEQIFNYLESQNKKIVIALDEFQQILKYSEQNTEALLRSFIQRSKNILFIFSGSRKHLLEAMFRDSGRPFYNSTEMLFLEKINTDAYHPFISKKFKEGGKKIAPEQIDQLLEWCRVHTWYVQYVCNRLYSLPKNVIDVNILHQMMVTILEENEPGYYGYRNLLTSFQWKVLNAIAQEKNLTEPNGKKFLTKYQLGAASSVSLAIEALLDKELIYRENDIFNVYDVFLSRWMERKV
ncbi:MAG: AAA family ATPase [Bacteroidetes bacterium]|nr:AAA family ATPase [Bacteroidota bacterium]